MGFDPDIISDLFLVLGLATIGLEMCLALFISFIYVPRLRKELEDLFRAISQNWTELQILSSSAYFNISYTSDTLQILRANKDWVYFNFCNTFYSDTVQEQPGNFLFTEWSESAFKNIFTVILAMILYAIVFLIFRLGLKKSKITEFLQFEIGLQIMKTMVFTVTMALCIEIYRLNKNESASYNTGIVSFIALGMLVVYPIGKILYLRLKHLGNLDASEIEILFGSDYRPYQQCWREFHLLAEQSLLLIIPGSLVFLNNFEEAQLFIVLGSLCMLLLYTIIFKPFRHLRLNLEATYSRAILSAHMGILSGSYFYSSTEYQEYGVLGLLLLWYIGKIAFVVWQCYITFDGIKNLLDKSQPTEIIQSKLLKEVNNVKSSDNMDELTIVTGGREKDEGGLKKSVTEGGAGKRRIKRGNGDMGEDDIDPRLSRKRTTRRKKSLNLKNLEN